MMPLYFIYIDESGGNLLEPRQHFFVLAATAIRVDECMAIQEKVSKLKQEYFSEIRPEDIDVKGYNLEQAKKFFKHVRLEVRREIVKRLLEFLMAHEVSLFATVLSKKEEAVQRLDMHPDDEYRYAYKNLVKRLDRFLESKKEYGILFIDSQASSIRSHLKDDRLLRFHQECLKELRKAGREKKIVEYPLFVQSEFFAATQLTDLCAYHIARALHLRYGKPFEMGGLEFMSPIDHSLFTNGEFLDSLFSIEEINLPVIAKLLKRSGGIEKLP